MSYRRHRAGVFVFSSTGTPACALFRSAQGP